MSKKPVLAAVVISAIFLSAGIGYFFFRVAPKKTDLPDIIPEAVSPTPAQIGKATYDDEAGFSFDYPADLKVVEKDLEDGSVYSSLELLEEGMSEGGLTIKITDTTAVSLDSWLAKNKETEEATESGEITLSGFEARRMRYGEPERNRLVAVDSGILYLIESPAEVKWSSAFNLVVSTFQLTVEEKQAGGSAPAGDSGIIEEAEEVIE